MQTRLLGCFLDCCAPRLLCHSVVFHRQWCSVSIPPESDSKCSFCLHWLESVARRVWTHWESESQYSRVQLLKAFMYLCVYVFSGKPLCDNHNSQLNITVCEIQEQLQVMHYECQVINDFNTTLRFGKRFRHWSWEEWRIFQHYESTTVEPRFVVLSESQVSSLVQLNTLTGPLSPNTNHLHRWSQTGRNDQPMVFQAVAAHSSSRRQAKYSGIYWECKQSILNQYSINTQRFCNKVQWQKCFLSPETCFPQ